MFAIAVLLVFISKGYLTDWMDKYFGIKGSWIGIGFGVATLMLSPIFNEIWKKLFNAARPEDKVQQDAKKRYSDFVSNGTVSCINFEREGDEECIYVHPKLYAKAGSQRLAAAKKIASWKSTDSDFIVLYSDAPSGKQKFAIKAISSKLFPIYLIRETSGEPKRISDIVRTIAEAVGDTSFTYIINCEKTLKAEDVRKIKDDIANVQLNLRQIKVRVRIVLLVRYLGTLQENWEYKVDCLDNNEIMAFAKEYSRICNEHKLDDPLAIIRSRHNNATGIILDRVSGGNPSQLANYLYSVAKGYKGAYASPSSAFEQLLIKRTKEIELDDETKLRFHAILHLLITLSINGEACKIKLCALKGVWGSAWFEEHSTKLKDYLIAAGFWRDEITLYNDFPPYHGSENEKTLLGYFAACCGKYGECGNGIGFYDQWVELSRWLWANENVRAIAKCYWPGIIHSAIDYWLIIKIPDEANNYKIYSTLDFMRRVVADLDDPDIKEEASALGKQLKRQISKTVDDLLAHNAARMSSKIIIDVCWQELYACWQEFYSDARDFVFRLSELLPYLCKASPNPITWCLKLDVVKARFDDALKASEGDTEIADRMYAIAFSIANLFEYSTKIIEYSFIDEWRQYLSGLMVDLQKEGKFSKALLGCVDTVRNLKREEGPISMNAMANAHKAVMATIQLPTEYGAALYTTVALHYIGMLIPEDNGKSDELIRELSLFPMESTSSLPLYRKQFLQWVILQMVQLSVDDIKPEDVESLFDSIKVKIDWLGAQAGMSFENSPLALLAIIGVYNRLFSRFGNKNEYEDGLSALRGRLETEVLARYEAFSYEEWCALMATGFIQLGLLSDEQRNTFRYYWRELLNRIYESGTGEIKISEDELQLFVQCVAYVYNDANLFCEYGTKMVDAVFKNSLFYFVTGEWKERWLQQAALPFAFSSLSLYVRFVIKYALSDINLVYSHGDLSNGAPTILQKWLTLPTETKNRFACWLSKGIESLHHNIRQILSAKGLDFVLRCIADTQEAIYCFALPFAYAWLNEHNNEQSASHEIKLDEASNDVICQIVNLIKLFNSARALYGPDFAKKLERMNGWEKGLAALDEFVQSDGYTKMIKMIQTRNHTLYENVDEAFVRNPIEFVQKNYPGDAYEQIKLINTYLDLIPSEKITSEIKLALYDYIKDLPAAISEQTMSKDGHVFYLEVLTHLYNCIKGQRRGLFKECHAYLMKYWSPYASHHDASFIATKAREAWKTSILSAPSRLVAKLRRRKS